MMSALKIIANAAAMTSMLVVKAFVVSPPSFSRYFHGCTTQSTTLSMMSQQQHGRKQDVTIPLLDLSDSEHANQVVTPLPSAHLPPELATLHLYGMELKRPIHKMLIQHVVNEQSQGEERMYGYIVEKPNGGDDSLIGAIGCATEVLAEAHPQNDEESDSEVGNDSPIVVLCRGSYRFKVKDVMKTFPYPVAVVHELVDDELSSNGTGDDSVESDDDTSTDDDDDEDDDDDNRYNKLDSTELVRRIMVGLKKLVDQKLENIKPDLSPLEQSILEESGQAYEVDADSQQAEEMAAVFEIFQSSLIDIAPMPVDRYYAIAMMAAEMANVDNDVRKELITMTNGVERMRIVLRELEEEVNMNQARRVADTITDEIDEGSKDLKVGTPTLPPWVAGIKDGTRIEYFWNEEEGWCSGVIDGEPMKVVDELIVCVRFDDGETHRLPITPDEKVRWRPPQDP